MGRKTSNKSLDRKLKAVVGKHVKRQEAVARSAADAVKPIVAAWARRHRMRVEYHDTMGVQWFEVQGRRKAWEVYYDDVDPGDARKHPHYRFKTSHPTIRAFLGDLIALLEVEGDLEDDRLPLFHLAGYVVDHRDKQPEKRVA
jgi:hypothetical protein